MLAAEFAICLDMDKLNDEYTNNTSASPPFRIALNAAAATFISRFALNLSAARGMGKGK